MTIEDVIAAFDYKTVMVLGDVMLDRYIYGSCERISPEAPVPVVKWEREDYKLGGAANVALNLKALGAKVVLCGLIQEDESGKKIIGTIRDLDIVDRTIGIRTGRIVIGPTITKTRICVGNQQVCRVDREAPALENEVLLDFSGCDAIFVSDYGKGFITDPVMEQVRETGLPFYCDPKDRNLEKYRGSSGITPNEKEALAFDLPWPSETFLANLHRLKIETCLLTKGENGIQYWDTNLGAIPFQMDGYKRELADACGAGDTAFAVYGLCKTVGASTGMAAGLANLAASLVCEHFGVVPVTRLQLVNALL